MGNWAAAHGWQDVFKLCNTLVTISTNGSQRLPLFPNNPNYGNFEQDFEGMRAVLLLVANTTFGMYHKVNAEQLQQMDKHQVCTIFADFAQVPSVGSALGCWVNEGWDWLFIFLQDMLLK
jgi:hypothetical protein